jgi:YD repeat-containing protein
LSRRGKKTGRLDGPPASTGVPAAPTVSYTYGSDAASNNNGRLLTMTDGVGSETNTYDLMGRITKVARMIGAATYNIGYGYNSADQITSITYPSTRLVQQAYDAVGRLTSIASAGTTYISVAPTNGFNASQQPLNISYGSGVTGAFGYNDHLQMSSLAYTKGSNTLLNDIVTLTRTVTIAGRSKGSQTRADPPSVPAMLTMYWAGSVRRRPLI